MTAPVQVPPGPTSSPDGTGAPPPPRRWHLPTGASHYLIWTVTLLVVVGPVVPIVLASLWSTPLYQAGGELTLGNYQDLLTDPSWWDAVRNSLVFAAVTTLLSVFFGVGAAVLFTRTNLPLRRFLTGVLLLPVLLPGLVLLVGWMSMWAPSGYGAAWLGVNTPFSVPIDLYTLPGMVLVATTIATPVVFLFCRSGVLSIDASLEQAGRTAGAGPARVLRTVTVPLLRPSILNSAILVFAVSFEVLGLPLLLGFANDITLVSTYLYDNWINVRPPQHGLVSAGAVFLLAAASALLVLRNRLVGDAARFTTVTGKASAKRDLDLGRARWPTTAAILLVQSLLILVPLGGVILTAFTTILTPFISPWSVLTTANFEAVFDNRIFVDSIRNSMLIATVGGLLATVAIALIAVVAHRSGFRFRGSLQQVVMWPRLMPGLVTGMAFFWAFVVLDPNGAVRTSLWGIGIAFAVRSLAVGYSAFYPSLVAIGEDLDRAARTSGATWWQATVMVALRLSVPAMGACFILMFVSLLNEVEPAVFLVTDRTPVMGLTMLQLAASNFGGAVAAFGVIQMLITVVVLGVGRLLLGARTHA